MVRTVLGEIETGALGVTLMHEHAWIDRYGVTGDYNKRLMDERLVVAELGAFRRAGGTTICDVTPPGIGRDPRVLQRISVESGLHIVMGSGWYLEPYHPAEVARMSVSALADCLVDEIEHGVGDTGVRPGIIGEIGSGLVMTPAEERALRAAARAQKATGLPLTTHAFASDVALHQLEVLREERVALSSVIIGHQDSIDDYELHETVARSGAWLQFDLLRAENAWEIRRRVDMIARIFESGLQDRLLLSHDVCMKSHLAASGGGGYTAVFDTLVPALTTAGIEEAEVHEILTVNPRRVFEE